MIAVKYNVTFSTACFRPHKVLTCEGPDSDLAVGRAAQAAAVAGLWSLG